MTDAEVEKVRSGREAAPNDYVEASLSLDAEKCLECFARTEEPVMAPDSKLLVGWDARRVLPGGSEVSEDGRLVSIQEYARLPARARCSSVLGRV